MRADNTPMEIRSVRPRSRIGAIGPTLLVLVLVCALVTPSIAFGQDVASAVADQASVEAASVAIKSPPEIRVGLVRTAAAAATRCYIRNVPLNEHYDSRIDTVRSALTDAGFSVGTVNDAALASVATLEQYDVLVFPMTLATTSAQRSAILTYTARGGGIVGSFGLSRWDAQSTYTYGYLPFLGMQGAPGVYTWPPSSNALKPWEWGEISEIYNTTFKNDPIMYGGYRLEQASSHWILQQTQAEAGRTLLVDKPNRYNEVMSTLPGAGNVTMLYRYNTLANSNAGDDGESGDLAAWTTEYYFGRFVYFGFHLHDLIVEGWAADRATANTARRVLVNSVRWAASTSRYAPMRKSVELTGRAWYTRSTLYIDETITNTGSISLRGPLKVEVADPSGKVVYTGQAYNKPCPVPPGSSYTHKSYTVPLSRPAPGTWTVKMTYGYYDYFRGGWVTVSRLMRLTSTGAAMGPSSLLAQSLTGGNAPVIGARVAGGNRYETAVRLSERGWPNGAGQSGAVVLATGGNYPDALAAAPLAGALDAPILLVPPSGPDGAVAAELRRLFRGRTSASVVIVGGTGAVSAASAARVTEILEDAGVAASIERLAGVNRYDTARAIALRVGAPREGRFARTALIVSGENYPDALAAGGLAAAAGTPILPVMPNAVPAQIDAALAQLGIEHCVIVGGTGAVGASVEQRLESAGYRKAGVADGSMDPDTRLAGADRYATALLAGRLATSLGGFGTRSVFFATGTNWPDALALAPVAGKERSTLALVAGSDLAGSPAVASHLMTRRDDPPGCVFIGGPAAVSDLVRGQVRAALRL